jgi:DNA topoisomerase-1
LEENGIGRPSTYAAIISTIQDREYVRLEKGKFFPTDLGLLVTDLLVKNFPRILDVAFTASLETDLDRIEEGKIKRLDTLNHFYRAFTEELKKAKSTMRNVKKEEIPTDLICEKCGKPMVIKMGRFGKFLACTGFPECRNTKTMGPDGVETDAKNAEATNEKCEKCGLPMVLKRGRFGPFLSCSDYPKCKTVKSILKKLGVKCPSCGEGEIIEKKTRKGKTFYACSRYPKCEFALWNRPTGDVCPTCGSLLVLAKADMVRCSNQECKFERPVSKE